MSGRERPVSALQLMVQTPGDLFVYWEISREYLDLARLGLRDSLAQLVLLLFREDPEQVEKAAFVPLDGDVLYGTFYFNGQRPWKTYYAELALNCKGTLFTLLRSNKVVTPPAPQRGGEARPPVPVQWQDVPPRLPFAYSPEEGRVT